ncbi:MAG: efflux RND transporter permease subunit [Planctomycetota bacterium]
MARPDEENLVTRLVRASVVGPLSPLLIVLAIAAGAVAILYTPREEEPQIVVPMADIYVQYPGASAQEVEKLVATPLEKLLWQIDGVEHVYSMSTRDHAIVTVRFFVGEDRERALVRLQSKIAAHRDMVPPGVTGWVVKPVEIDDVPIVTLTLYSTEASDAEIRRVAEEVAARLDPIPDLSRSAIIGGRPREVRVEFDPDALAAHGLSPLEVSRALGGADASLPAGTFDRADEHIAVAAGPFVGGKDEVEDLVIGAWGGRPVHLKDVARVLDGPAERTEYVRMAFGPASAEEGVDVGRPYPAVTVALSKKKGTNAVWVAEEVVKRAEQLREDVLPENVRMLVTRDYGVTADEKVNELFGHLLLAIITVIGLIAYALGWREGLIVAAAVPITFALTLLVNLLVGYTINRVTLFALVLVLGMVCDDPIVDVENIHRHFMKRKLPPLKAVLFAVNEVRPPVIFATVAVILSFLPMLFITGMMGPYMRPMAVNVPVAMAMSLLVAFTITPWMAFYLLRPMYGKPDPHGTKGRVGFFRRIYRGVVSFFLDHRSARWVLLFSILALMGIAGEIALSGKVPLKMLPYDNKSEFQILLDLPDDATLERMDSVAEEFERYLATVPEVTNYQSYVGVSSPIDFNGLVRHYGLRRAPNLADLRVNLVSKNERTQRSHDLTLRIRKDLEALAAKHGARLKIVEMPPGPPVLSTLVAEVHGPPQRSYEELVEGGRELERRLSVVEGVVDTDVMAEDDRKRLDFDLDKEKAALHGVATADVVRTLRLALTGDFPATVHEPNEREPLRIRLVLPRALRSGASELSRLRVKGKTGVLVPLAEIGELVERKEDHTIYHKDLERVVFVVGDIAGRPPADVVFAMQDELLANPLPGEIEARWNGEGEWKITLDVFRDLGIAFFGALIAIYALLVVETKSFFMPLVVMAAIPLGLIGIMPGFWLLNHLTAQNVGGFLSPVWFTATGMIGMIALAGIVIRNAILLIDFIRTHVAEGMGMREAVLESGYERMRPITLTALTTMIGAWPITLDPIFSGLAWALIFGILTSTAFTLIVIPVVYFALYRNRKTPAVT